MVLSTNTNMSEQAKINTLSSSSPVGNRQGNAIVMVGSFAPIHKGHFDAVRAASIALSQRGYPVESVVLTPNSPQYVQRKLPEYHRTWTYERRIQEILRSPAVPHISTYVDDVSGRSAGLEQINDFVPFTIRRHLGFTACQTHLIVGSDQILSVESHLRNETNRAVCVLRPGTQDYAMEQLDRPWVAEAVEEGRFIIAEREDMENDYSSSAIRQSVVAGSGMA